MPSQRSPHVATLLLIVTILVASPSTATSRAVNISSTWFLPQEGFPVFYRYFRDRITWLEADAVCQFHHANLVTVDTSVQYDATRAYLKELDIVNNVWIGLKRSTLNEDFKWTDSKALTQNGGYWHEQIPKSSMPLCAAADPAADFRWHSLNCGGPEVASFICEMPVPPWASEDDGCMLTSLPSLSVIFLPEQGAVELTSDCGQDGTRRIACKGQANREEMMRQLSCDHGSVSQEDELGSMSPEVTSSSSSTISSSSSSSGTSISSSSSSPSSSSLSASSSSSLTLLSSLGTSQSSNSLSTLSSSASYTATTGTRAWTGLSNEAPTRHRRDADQIANSQMISLLRSTTAVSEDISTQSTINTSQEMNTGTITSIVAISTDMTASSEYKTNNMISTAGPQESTENVTMDNQIPNQLPVSQSSMVNKPTYSTATVKNIEKTTDENTAHKEDVYSEFEEMKVVENSVNDLARSSTSGPLTTINVLIASTSGDFNNSQTDNVPTPVPTMLEVLDSEPSVVLNETEVKNVTDEVLMSTSDVTVVSTTEITDDVSTTTEEDISNLSIQAMSQKPTEEDEEERLKEDERKEEEKKFKNEEEDRRRLFLPSPLRSVPIMTEMTSKAPVVAPVIEEAYEEPGEIVETEPEVPSRPNRGRRLTRPQTHSFYPYFLNRVLG